MQCALGTSTAYFHFSEKTKPGWLNFKKIAGKFLQVGAGSGAGAGSGSAFVKMVGARYGSAFVKMVGARSGSVSAFL